MDYTENIDLKKPSQDDYYNVDDFNENADIIDKKISELNKNVTDFTEDCGYLQLINTEGATAVGYNFSPNFAGVIGGDIILKGKMEFTKKTDEEVTFSNFYIKQDNEEVQKYFDNMISADGGTAIGIVGFIRQTGNFAPIMGSYAPSTHVLYFYCTFSDSSDCYYDIRIPTLWRGKEWK